MENLAAAAGEEVAVPVPKACWHGHRRSKSDAGESPKDEAKKRGRPGTAAAECCRDSRVIRERYERPAAEPKPGVPTYSTAHEDRASPHFEGCRLPAIPADGKNPAPHPLARKLADITSDDHHAASEAMVTADEATGHIVSG